LVPELYHHPIKKEEESKKDEERLEREAYASLSSPIYASLWALSHLSSFTFTTILLQIMIP
jgi:hypothetical protein